MYQVMVGVLSMSVMAGAYAAQEGFGRPAGSAHMVQEFTCTPFHSASGQILVGAMAPALVSAQGTLILRTGAVSPFAKPVFTALTFAKSLPMSGGASVEIYQAPSITVRVIMNGQTPQSATIQFGAATAVCQPAAQ
jgi:hypothetical protein